MRIDQRSLGSARVGIGRLVPVLPILFACKSSAPTDDAMRLAYDREQLLGKYTMTMNADADGEPVSIEMVFEVAEGEGDRLDLFVTSIWDGHKRLEDDRVMGVPVHDFALDQRGPSDARVNPEGFLKDGTDIAESFFFLWPDTPPGEIAVGAKWSGKRVLPLGKRVPEHPELDVEYEVIRFEPCPTPVDPLCAVYRYSVATGPQSPKIKGIDKVHYEYVFEGTGRFSLRGYPVDAHGSTEGDVELGDRRGHVKMAVMLKRD